MSHWTTVKTKIKSLAHLREAAKELGLVLETRGITAGQSVIATGYGSARKSCLAKITSTNPKHSWRYDIAIDKAADGTLELTTDWYDHKQSIVGEQFKKLNQLYTVHATMAAVKSKGWTATKRILKDGTIQVCASGM